VCPPAERLANELRSVIQDQFFRPPTLVCQSIENLDDAGAGQGRIHLAGQPSPAESVHDVEGPELPPGDQPILNKVHCPPLIELSRGRQGRRRGAAYPLPPAPANRQALFAIEPVHTLMVHLEPFALEQDRQPSIPKAPPLLG
jgi:hypothetical protein